VAADYSWFLITHNLPIYGDLKRTCRPLWHSFAEALPVDEFDIFRVVSGKIVERWELIDRYAMLIQLGDISEVEAA